MELEKPASVALKMSFIFQTSTGKNAPVKEVNAIATMKSGMVLRAEMVSQTTAEGTPLRKVNSAEDHAPMVSSEIHYVEQENPASAAMKMSTTENGLTVPMREVIANVMLISGTVLKLTPNLINQEDTLSIKELKMEENATTHKTEIHYVELERLASVALNLSLSQ